MTVMLRKISVNDTQGSSDRAVYFPDERHCQPGIFKYCNRVEEEVRERGRERNKERVRREKGKEKGERKKHRKKNIKDR